MRLKLASHRHNSIGANQDNTTPKTSKTVQAEVDIHTLIASATDVDSPNDEEMQLPDLKGPQ